MLKNLTHDGNSQADYLGGFLIVMASILLGIWATKNTIALRNILLVLGSILSVVYVARLFLKNGFTFQISFTRVIPIMLLLAMFIWVLVHYLFFSRMPELQLQELKSTWLRAFLAFIFAIGIGMAIRQKSGVMPILWLGILGSFVILFLQYIPKALSNNSLMATDWYGGYYIYIGKINGVLMGTLMLAGLGGAWIDKVRQSGIKDSFWESIIFFLGFIFSLYAYVFIFDTRNGLALAALLIFGWLAFGFYFVISRVLAKKTIPGLVPISISVLLITLIFGWFGTQQINRNAGWSTMIEDAKISVQIEKFPNWKNTEKMGFPSTEDGRVVAGNTYERVAWATVGLSLIPKNPLGLGILHRTFTKLLQDDFPGASPPSTHSAWIELTLAFGIPGLVMIAGALISIILLTVFSPPKRFVGSVLSLSMVILAIYTVGELSVQHAVEILFFLITLLAVLQLPESSHYQKNSDVS